MHTKLIAGSVGLAGSANIEKEGIVFFYKKIINNF